MFLILTLIGIVTFLLYQFLKPSEDYWKKYGVRQLSTSFTDNIKVIFGKISMGDTDEAVYKQLGSDKFCGLVQLQQPILLVKDLDIAKKVLIKDFDYFVDRRNVATNQKQLKKMLINMEGDDWKGLRSSLSPTFTTGKIRRMMGVVNQISNELVDHLKKEIKESDRNSFSMNISKGTINYTVDVIAAAAFGIKANVTTNPHSQFGKMFQQLTDAGLVTIIKFAIGMNFPKLISMLGIQLLDEESMNYFENLLAQGLKSRTEGKVKMNDFLQILVEARKGELKADGSDELNTFEKEAQLSVGTNKKNLLEDDDFANAQMLLFFFAGSSTTANFIGFTLYMLALHPEMQSKLREEVNSQLFNSGDDKTIDYDKVNELVYLDMITCEVLRKFPALGRLERKCVKEYHDPSESLKVPKGTIVSIPVQAIHNDKKYYDHPDKFYPEHFTPENKAKRNPYAYLPFGSGPRNCIGMRFALVEGKAAIAHLVHNFKIEPNAKTPIPYKVKPVGGGVQLCDDLELSFKLAN